MCIKRKLLVSIHVRKWECAQLGNAQVGRAQNNCAQIFCAQVGKPEAILSELDKSMIFAKKTSFRIM